MDPVLIERKPSSMMAMRPLPICKASWRKRKKGAFAVVASLRLPTSLPGGDGPFRRRPVQLAAAHIVSDVVPACIRGAEVASIQSAEAPLVSDRGAGVRSRFGFETLSAVLASSEPNNAQRQQCEPATAPIVSDVVPACIRSAGDCVNTNLMGRTGIVVNRAITTWYRASIGVAEWDSVEVGSAEPF